MPILACWTKTLLAQHWLGIRAPTTLAEAMSVAVTVGVNLSHCTNTPFTTTTPTCNAQVSELANQMDKLLTRWATHPYASCQCTNCGRQGHSTLKCGIKCIACGRWGHTADVYCSKGPIPTNSGNNNDCSPRNDSRTRPHYDFSIGGDTQGTGVSGIWREASTCTTLIRTNSRETELPPA